MKLTDLNATFLRYEERDGRVFSPKADTIDQAQGVMFLCPQCYRANGGAAGTHRVICWSRSRGVPEHATPGPGRWSLHGTGLHDLTLLGDPVGGASSVQITAGCQWHGFVTDGQAA